MEVEDLRLYCADMKAEAVTAREQVAPLAVRVKELEEGMTRAAGERDILSSRADEAQPDSPTSWDTSHYCL